MTDQEPELIPQEIDDTPTAIRSTLVDAQLATVRLANEIRQLPARRIFITGNGSSLYTSLAGTYVARALAGPDDPLVIALPAGDFRYFQPQVSPQDVVIGMSASGEFRDLLEIFKRLAGKCKRIGVTQVPGSTLTRLTPDIVFSTGGPSHVPVMTKTYASTLTALYRLLLETFIAPSDYFADLADCANKSLAGIERMKALLPVALPIVSRFKHVFYFGAGSAYPAALEGALKLKEMALTHAEGNETCEMASGSATIVSSESLCVALYTGDASDDSTAISAVHARKWGARVLEIGPNAHAGDLFVPVNCPNYAMFAPLVLVPPLALLAYHVARQNGLDPNHPFWKDRYTSQGMNHIIGG